MTTNTSRHLDDYWHTFVDNFDMLVVSKHILIDAVSTTRKYACKIRLHYKPTERSLVCSYQHTVHPFQMDREIQKEKVIAMLAFNALCKLKHKCKRTASTYHRHQVERSNDACKLRYVLGADQFLWFIAEFEAHLNN